MHKSTYCLPFLIKLLIVVPLLVTEAFPPKPTTSAVTIALLPPEIIMDDQCSAVYDWKYCD